MNGRLGNEDGIDVSTPVRATSEKATPNTFGRGWDLVVCVENGHVTPGYPGTTVTQRSPAERRLLSAW